jgi:hypothetical protein
MVIIMITLWYIVAAQYKNPLYCTKYVNGVILKSLKKLRDHNNTVVLSRDIQIVSNKTGVSEEFVKKCLGITS